MGQRLIILFMTGFFAGFIFYAPARSQAHEPFFIKAKPPLLTWGISTGLAFTGAYFYSRNEPPDPSKLDINRLPAWDRFAVNYYSASAASISDITLIASISLPFTVSVLNGSKTHIEQDAVMFTQSALILFGLMGITKGLTGRARPYAYNAQFELEPDASRSFFSGHTAAAFLGAVYAGRAAQMRYPDAEWVRPLWYGALICAGATGVLRIAAGRHFPSDVITGALAGAGTALLITEFYKNKNSDSQNTGSPMYVSFSFSF